MNTIIIISFIILISGIIFLVLAIKKSRKNNKNEIPEVTILKKIIEPNPRQELQKMTIVLKQYIKRTYHLTDKFSLNELTAELSKEGEVRLRGICEKIKPYYYTKKNITKKETDNIKEEMIISINETERERIRNELKERRYETPLERIKRREQEIKDRIRIQRIIHSKLGTKREPKLQEDEE